MTGSGMRGRAFAEAEMGDGVEVGFGPVVQDRSGRVVVCGCEHGKTMDDVTGHGTMADDVAGRGMVMDHVSGNGTRGESGYVNGMRGESGYEFG